MPSPGLTGQVQPAPVEGSGPFSRNLIPDESQKTGSQEQQTPLSGGQLHNQGRTASQTQSQTSTSQRPTAVRNPAEYLSAGWLDGDETEQDILSGIVRSGSTDRLGQEGRELGADLKRVEHGSSGGRGGVLGRAYLFLLAYYQHALGNHPASIETYGRVDWAGEMDTTGHEMGLSLTAQRVDWLRGMVLFGQCPVVHVWRV